MVIFSDEFWKVLEGPLSPLLQKFLSVVSSRSSLLITPSERSLYVGKKVIPRRESEHIKAVSRGYRSRVRRVE